MILPPPSIRHVLRSPKATAPFSERAHGLVDLQLLDADEDLDLVQVRATCIRLFLYRNQQTWPPTIVAGHSWDTHYLSALEGLDALPDIDVANAWANAFIARIDAAGH